MDVKAFTNKTSGRRPRSKYMSVLNENLKKLQLENWREMEKRQSNMYRSTDQQTHKRLTNDSQRAV